MERKRYLRAVVTSLRKKIDKENLLHLGHFAYDKKNHPVLIELNTVDLLQSFFSLTDTKVIELALGALCNLSSNPLVHRYLEIPIITSQ